MARLTRILHRDREIQRQAKPLAYRIWQWQKRYALMLLPELIGAIKGRVRKEELSPQEKELLELLETFGLRQINSKGIPEELIKSSVVQQFLKSKKISVQSISGTTKDILETAIRDALISNKDAPIGAVARALREDIKSSTGQVISFERANVIARTEIAAADNNGTLVGLQVTGVEYKEWMAFSDGKSGDRHHERMDGMKVPVNEPFITPLGNKLMYPGDPRAPVKDIAGCRCGLGAA